MEPYVNTGRKDYLKELKRLRTTGPGGGMYVNPNPRDIPGHANKPNPGVGGKQLNPIDFVEYHDAGPNGEIYREMEKSQKDKRKLEQKFQTEGKKTLLNQQPTRSKGGGKSGGGGGGKWGWIRRAINRPSSPWSLLKSDKNY
jgi:hypothetical protein